MPEWQTHCGVFFADQMTDWFNCSHELFNPNKQSFLRMEALAIGAGAGGWIVVDIQRARGGFDRRLTLLHWSCIVMQSINWKALEHMKSPMRRLTAACVKKQCLVSRTFTTARWPSNLHCRGYPKHEPIEYVCSLTRE